MREILLTSSALILALLVLRRAFRRKISRRVQYALWGLVLLRLLAPANLPAADFSVLSALRPVREQAAERLEREPVYVLPVAAEEFPLTSDGCLIPDPKVILPIEGRYSVIKSEDGQSAVMIDYAFTLEEALDLLWKAGMAAMAAWLVCSNLRFWLLLRKRRVPLELLGRKYPVYLVEEGLASPCLFGLLRPAVYLTPAALETEEGLGHVLAHEETHRRHLDPLWSLLRGVCLAVYWFDPLVWLAAWAAREDCELACDEGAIGRLGEDQRIPYGQTLLRLIPVKKSPGGALLAATTMTSDKRRLKERVTRIAENRRMKAAALCAALAMTAAVCAATFTGCAAPEPAGPVPLTQEELDYFTKEYFNPEDLYDGDDGGHLNRRAMRNMFLTSLYETPADIDLYGLIYMGVPVLPGAEERPRAGFATVLERVWGGAWPDCATYEATGPQLDAVLREYAGIPLADTNRVGLPETTPDRDYALEYLEDYDTYYWCHGDFFYPNHIVFQSGEREGDLVRLVYENDFVSGGPVDGPLRVTLRDLGEGKYQFVSNLAVSPAAPEPAGPPAPARSGTPAAQGLPLGELVLTVPLTDLAPCAPVPVETVPVNPPVSGRHGDHHGETGHQDRHATGGGHHTAGDCATFGWSMDGTTYISSHRQTDGSYPGDYFLRFDGQEYEEEEFTGLLGYDGVRISYYGEMAENHFGVVNDYYVFSEGAGGGTDVFLLARAYGRPAILDLDGDGTVELAASGWSGSQLFFQRDGQIYAADIVPLLERYWPEAEFMECWDGWDPACRYLSLWAFVGPEGGGDGYNRVTAWRRLAFDGEKLLLYKRETAPGSHILTGIPAPGAVLEAAGETARDYLAYRRDLEAMEGYERPEWDDYRVSVLTPAYPAAEDRLPEGLELAVYELGVELHTATPERVVLAGGIYVDEDGWVGGFGPDSAGYLAFQLREDGSIAWLGSLPCDFDAGSPAFLRALNQILADHGLPQTGGSLS